MPPIKIPVSQENMASVAKLRARGALDALRHCKSSDPAGFDALYSKNMKELKNNLDRVMKFNAAMVQPGSSHDRILDRRESFVHRMNYYAGAVSAQKEFVDRLRLDPKVEKNDILDKFIDEIEKHLNKMDKNGTKKITSKKFGMNKESCPGGDFCNLPRLLEAQKQQAEAVMFSNILKTAAIFSKIGTSALTAGGSMALLFRGPLFKTISDIVQAKS